MVVAHHCDPSTQMKDSAARGAQDQPGLCMTKQGQGYPGLLGTQDQKPKQTDKFLIFNLKSIWDKSRPQTPHVILRKKKAQGLICTDSRLTTKPRLARPCGADEGQKHKLEQEPRGRLIQIKSAQP